MMGIPIMGPSGCDCCRGTVCHNDTIDTFSGPYERPKGNPKPTNFNIRTFQKIGNYVLLDVEYPDCKNFEGVKILVFRAKDLDVDDIKTLDFLDPHFCDTGDHPSPIARFEPTDEGWELARVFCLVA